METRKRDALSTPLHCIAVAGSTSLTRSWKLWRDGLGDMFFPSNREAETHIAPTASEDLQQIDAAHSSLDPQHTTTLDEVHIAEH